MVEARKNEPKIEADDVLAGIVEWVSIESPSHDAKSVNKVVDHVEGQFRDLGLKLERIPGRDGFGDILECKTPSDWSHDPAPAVLVDPAVTRRQGKRVRRADAVFSSLGIESNRPAPNAEDPVTQQVPRGLERGVPGELDGQEGKLRPTGKIPEHNPMV